MIRILIVISFILSTISFAHGAEKIQYMTEQNLPYNFEKDGELQGIAVDLLLEMGRQTGYPVASNDIKMLPWPRGYHILEKTPSTALFSMARTEQRENLFKWVGPIKDHTIAVIAAKGKNLKIESINDLNELRIGTILNSAPEQLLITEGYDIDKLDRAVTPEQNIKKLVANRFDAIAYNIDSMRYAMKSLSINPDNYEAVYVLKKTRLYFAYSKETNDAFIDLMNATLKRLKTADNTGVCFFDRIVFSYLGSR